MYLEDILQTYFGLKGGAFGLNGLLNIKGLQAYRKLTDLIKELADLGVLNADEVIKKLDEIEYEDVNWEQIEQLSK